MELKQPRRGAATRGIGLLIVPYGIETAFARGRGQSPNLLIVPYGIETHLNSALILGSLLLIVPYGIETML